MITRMSELFLRTLRDDPADAEVPSHKLLIRAGYIRPIAPGLYSWLPLGLKVLRKIERVVRDEMAAIGGQEILFPALLPRAPYETTGRWTEYGDDLFRLQDRRKNDMLLGPTHEELFTLTVKGEYSSYKDFPLMLFQIQTKYRDEARPRAGILRGREFIMKDSYSFDIDDDGLKNAYHAHREAYQKIFDAAGRRLRHRLGGVGRDGRQRVGGVPGRKRGRRGHLRALPGIRLRRQRRGRDHRGAGGAAVRGRCPSRWCTTPADTPTIATLVDWANAALGPRGHRRRHAQERAAQGARSRAAEWELLAVGVPGDREVDEKRLGAALEPAEYALLDDADFARNPFLVKGYIGPKGLQANGVRYLVDPRVVDGTAWITGADEPGKHVVGLVAGPRLHPGRHHRGRRGARRRPVARRRRAAGQRARHRDRPHLPARPQVRRRLHRRRARRGRQAGAADHGLLRHRGVPAGRGDRRTAPRRARPALAVDVCRRSTCTW